MGSPRRGPRARWNQRSRSRHGTAAFAGDVDGSTKSCVVAERPLLDAELGPLVERAAVRLLADEARATRGSSSRAIRSSRSAEPAKSLRRRSPEPGVVRYAAFVTPMPSSQQLELLRRLVERAT